jgi:hypothetical protein
MSGCFPMPSFYVWAPDDGDCPARPNQKAMTAEMAAKEWFERVHAALDHPAELRVKVEDQEGHRFEFQCTAETVTVFCARPIP